MPCSDNLAAHDLGGSSCVVDPEEQLAARLVEEHHVADGAGAILLGTLAEGFDFLLVGLLRLLGDSVGGLGVVLLRFLVVHHQLEVVGQVLEIYPCALSITDQVVKYFAAYGYIWEYLRVFCL